MTVRLSQEQQVWGVIPAAGVGRRMGSDRPKQYLEIGGKTILEITLMRFLDHPLIKGVVVVISPNDAFFPTLTLPNVGTRLSVAQGGEERCHSVLNGLKVLSTDARDDDWVLVHDAARPCVSNDDITHLIERVAQDSVGGLLGVPIADTVKQVDDKKRVQATLDRSVLWRALTPQMFRVGVLRECLERALAERRWVTDEASAIELSGYQPVIVEGSSDNIKITHPQDLAVAEHILTIQGSEP